MLRMRLHNHPLPDHQHIDVNEEAANALISKLGANLKAGVGGSSPLEVPAIIINLITSDLRSIVVALGGIDQTVATAQKAYATYVAPIDIPEVPNFIEPAVDHAIAYVLGVIIRAAWAKLNAQPTPLAAPGTAATQIGLGG